MLIQFRCLSLQIAPHKTEPKPGSSRRCCPHEAQLRHARVRIMGLRHCRRSSARPSLHRDRCRKRRAIQMWYVHASAYDMDSMRTSGWRGFARLRSYCLYCEAVETARRTTSLSNVDPSHRLRESLLPECPSEISTTRIDQTSYGRSY